jgi:hypothetical protein
MLFVVDVCPIKTVQFLSNVSLFRLDADQRANAAEIGVQAGVGRNFILIAINLGSAILRPLAGT